MIQNARIRSTHLGFEGHGIFTFMLSLEYGDGCVQGYGNWALDKYVESSNNRVGMAVGCELIIQVLKTVGVDSWEKLSGELIRVDGDFDRIRRIGHYMKDKWLDLSEYKGKDSL